MVRQTSIDAFNKIKGNGLLSRRKLEVYGILYKNGPLTAHEVVNIARKMYPKANQTGFNARLSELEKLGVVSVVGQKINSISNKQNALWDVTNKLPEKPSKILTTKQKLQIAEVILGENGLTNEYEKRKEVLNIL